MSARRWKIAGTWARGSWETNGWIYCEDELAADLSVMRARGGHETLSVIEETRGENGRWGRRAVYDALEVVEVCAWCGEREDEANPHALMTHGIHEACRHRVMEEAFPGSSQPRPVVRSRASGGAAPRRVAASMAANLAGGCPKQ